MTTRLRGLAVACLALAVATMLSAQTLGAQAQSSQAQSSQARSVDGRVRRPMEQGGDSTGMGPAVGQWVTLHRVGKDSAGPVDSVRTDAAGRYRLRYTPWGASDAVYFASTTYGGIAYFTEPLKAPAVTGEDAEITVFDTTSRAFPLSIKGRHFIVSQIDSAQMRTVIEVFEISNDSLLTRIAGMSTSPEPTWSVAIPASAIDVRANEGEFSPETFAATNGRVSVYAPMAPGVKQVAFSYKVPGSSFPLAMRADGGAVVFEVLLEEPRGTVKGKGFAAVDPVSLEGRNFRRFLAQDVEPDAEIIIDLPSAATPGRNLYIAGLLVAVGFLMMLALMRSSQRTAARRLRESANAQAARHDDVSSERLAQEIAALDANFARQENPSEAVQKAYTQRREELKRALADAMATESARK